MRQARWWPGWSAVLGLALLASACGGAAPTPPTAGPAADVTPPPTRPAGPPAQRPPAPPLSDEVRDELRRAGISTREWATDFGKRGVPLAEIMSGGPPKDGIPAIDAPRFERVAQADAWLDDAEPVQVLELNGDARAYPLQVLIWHEIVNDLVGGVPVSITFCPLCNTAIAFDARLPDGRVLDFGTTGRLRFSDLVMYDRQTESWWQQATGEAITGELTGTRLTFLPSFIVSWREFKAAHPDGWVLSRDTGFHRDYGRNPYVGYDSGDPFLFLGRPDGRLRATERVVTVELGGTAVAFPFSALERERVVHYTAGGQRVVVLFKKGTASALDASAIEAGRDVGAAAVFVPEANGKTLTFAPSGEHFTDRETGSTWDLLGRAIAGPFQGQRLAPVVHGNHFWFAWAAFRPDTTVYQGAS